MSVKRVATLGIFTALALILSLFEYLLPPIIPVLPFARVGISQIIILFILILFGARDALIVLITRSVFVSIFQGNPSMLLYSLPAGIICLIIMYIMLKIDKFGIPAISMLSGAVHNLIQIIIAALITKSIAVFIYLPYLMTFGAIAGMVIGIIVYLLIKKIPINLLKRFIS